MTDHHVEIVRDRDRFRAVCSCKRWTSDAYKKRDDAENKGDLHMVRGDQHLRALAQFSRGSASLATELKWYRSMATDPSNSEHDREQWQRLADELAKRIEGPHDSEDQPLPWD